MAMDEPDSNPNPNPNPNPKSKSKSKLKHKQKGESDTYIVTTRFNTETWNRNQVYREKNGIIGCFYSDQVRISSAIPSKTNVFIIEMNNSLNRIEGIGLVLNKIGYDEYTNVYDIRNYNRYVYSGKHRIDREILETHNAELVRILEDVLFKGKSHMKRGAGFTQMTPKIMSNPKCAHINILNEICKIFIEVYHKEGDTSP
jgi:hypothetical protein